MKLNRLYTIEHQIIGQSKPKPYTPDTKPSTPTKPKPARPNPFNPPKPAVIPTPKVRKKQVSEEYDKEVHPSTNQYFKDLIRDKSTVLGRNPIIAMYGDRLSREGWDYVRTKLSMDEMNVNVLMKLISIILQIESKHKEKLENLAIKIVSQIWGIPPDGLNAKLVFSPAEVGFDEEHIGIEQKQNEQIDQETLKKLLSFINKRLIANTITQGSSIHLMLSAHHIIDKEIRKIDPKLLEYYNKLSVGSLGYMWLMDVPTIMKMLTNTGAGGGPMAGSSVIRYMENDKPKIFAKAITFPVLVQELSKGVAELISLHGLAGLDAQTAKLVLQSADKIEFELPQFMIGPPLWRNLLKLKPPELEAADLIMIISMLDESTLTKLLMAAHDNPTQAKTMLDEILSQYGYNENDYHDGYDDEDIELPA